MQVLTPNPPARRIGSFDVAHLQWAPSGAHVLLNNLMGELTLVNVSTGASQYLDLSDRTYGVCSCVAFAPDHRTAVVLMTDMVGVVDVPSWQLTHKHPLVGDPLRGVKHYAMAIKFADHGRALCSWDPKDVRLGHFDSWFYSSLYF